jgi:hypothetical protein
VKRVLFLCFAAFLLAACDSDRKSLPFYLTHVEEMRRLPKDDLLRMKADILSKSAEMPDRKVADAVPENLEVVATGRIVATDGREKGTASLLRMPGDSLALLLNDFRVPNAPDLNVVIFSDSARFERLLRGNAGTQLEQLPPGTYRSIEIRSSLFDEVFAKAILDTP